ncbi:hypothetical protein [Neorhizobium galegae]|uniref:hypothetical protein n=1 Tax=Neorhizobium galegae TaxID=399 RepID=UPI000621EE68|nr:hypothetical protein [Neorhizobium galegae]CDZ54388.1 Hypothetical protein NGAL_HAMBI2427_56170 [Neorhizobium galegae bv. orientalis]
MASPWNLLARLVSPRRQQRQEPGSTDGLKPDLLAIAKPAEAAAENGLNTAEPQVDEKSASDDRSEWASASPDHSEETVSAVHGAEDIEGARPVEAGDPALSDEADTAARDAPKPAQTDESAAPNRRTRGKTAPAAEAVLSPSPAIPIVTDNAISLDDEIRLLRGQLARKLQLQNAQLKRMLERFER